MDCTKSISASAALNQRLEPLAYTIRDFAAVTGISRSSTYELIKDGTLDTVMVAGRRLVPRWAVEKLLGKAA
ncbi:MAG: helix-turn-helix domain-containing protein [Hyphomicrobiaceae bacterium]